VDALDTLLTLINSPALPIRSFLRVADLFMLRLTCRRAWQSVQHRTLTKTNVAQVALPQAPAQAHLPLVWWCLRHGAALHLTQYERIGQIGDCALVDECLTSGPPEVLMWLLRGAARGGHAELTCSLLSRKSPNDLLDLRGHSVRAAIAEGGLVTVAQLVDDHPPRWLEVCGVAVRRGHLAFVQWVLQDVPPPRAGEPWYPVAGTAGCVEVAKWLVNRGWPIAVEDPTLVAAATGDVAYLTWLLKRGFAPSADTLVMAAQHGHCHLVDWLLQHRCSLTPMALCWAAAQQTPAVVGFLLDHGCPLPDPPSDLTRWSCTNVHSNDLFCWLVERGMPWTPLECMEEARDQPAFDAAVIRRLSGVDLHALYLSHAVSLSDLDRLRYALAEGVEVDEVDLMMMIESAEVAMLLEVLRHWGPLTCDDRALLDAAVSQLDTLPDVMVQVLAKWGYEAVLRATDDSENGESSWE